MLSLPLYSSPSSVTCLSCAAKKYQNGSSRLFLYLILVVSLCTMCASWYIATYLLMHLFCVWLVSMIWYDYSNTHFLTLIYKLGFIICSFCYQKWLLGIYNKCSWTMCPHATNIATYVSFECIYSVCICLFGFYD